MLTVGALDILKIVPNLKPLKNTFYDGKQPKIVGKDTIQVEGITKFDEVLYVEGLKAT